MVTQAMKKWFRKMFAWWPWKRSTPFAYPRVAGAVASQAAPETYLWIARDGTIQQAGTTRRFILDSRAESLAPDAPPLATPVAFLQTDSDQENHGERSTPAPGAPTELQRLEFLRYLVQRGLVNEGFENDQAEH